MASCVVKRVKRGDIGLRPIESPEESPTSGDTSLVAALGWAVVGVGLGFQFSVIGLFLAPVIVIFVVALVHRYGTGAATVAGGAVGFSAVLWLFAALNSGERSTGPDWAVAAIASTAAAMIAVIWMFHLRHR